MAETVADYLTDARKAHDRYRLHAGHIDADAKPTAPNLLACGDAVRAALLARTSAHLLDPEHTDPAWREDARAMRCAHDALVDHYLHYLGVPIEALV